MNCHRGIGKHPCEKGEICSCHLNHPVIVAGVVDENERKIQFIRLGLQLNLISGINYIAP